jgi:hypothetical protein
MRCFEPPLAHGKTKGLGHLAFGAAGLDEQCGPKLKTNSGGLTYGRPASNH